MQMKWRLREGRGEAIYEIGVADNGLLLGLSENDLTSSLNTLKRMAERYVCIMYVHAYAHTYMHMLYICTHMHT